MKSLLAPSCSGLLLLGAFSIPATAQPSECNKTLQTVKTQLTKVRIFKTSKLTSSGQPKPKSRSLELNTIVDSEKVMNNAQMQLKIAKRIIANCPQIGLVTFNQYQTDWVNMYGLVNGKVQAFNCKDVGEEVKWGEHICL
jgi:hypothetical protein